MNELKSKVVDEKNQSFGIKGSIKIRFFLETVKRSHQVKKKHLFLKKYVFERDMKLPKPTM